MTWTTPKDIKDRTLTGLHLPTDGQLQTFINDVELQIKQSYKNIQERIDDGSLPLELIVSNVSFWIIEFLQTGGKPYAQESQAYTGAVSRSVTYNGGARTSLKLSDEDLAVFAVTYEGVQMIDFISGAHVSNSDSRGVWHPYPGFWSC